MENRNGLLVDACLTGVDGPAERIAATDLPDAGQIAPLATSPSSATSPVVTASSSAPNERVLQPTAQSACRIDFRLNKFF